jgi:hypothetical protein
VDQSTLKDQHATTINNNYFVTIQARMVQVSFPPFYGHST